MKFGLNSIKILILNLLISLNFFQIIYSFDESDVDPESADAKSIIDASGEWFDILDNIFNKFTEYIFDVIALILIGVFIYVGYLFITSSWDEAQFKKAWKTFVYAIIWIIIIILSWGTVKLITTIWI